jgi:hypothetical protein
VVEIYLVWPGQGTASDLGQKGLGDLESPNWGLGAKRSLNSQSGYQNCIYSLVSHRVADKTARVVISTTVVAQS